MDPIIPLISGSSTADPTPQSPLPRLPPELECEIFEIAAGAHSPWSSIHALSLVAHRVRYWVEPLIYSAVRIETKTDAKYFRRRLASRPAEYFIEHVKSLYIGPIVTTMRAHTQIPDDDITAMLTACSGLVNLACFQPISAGKGQSRLTYDLPELKRLFMGRHVSQTLMLGMGHFPPLWSVTHVYLAHGGFVDPERVWAIFPGLKYLLLSYPMHDLPGLEELQEYSFFLNLTVGHVIRPGGTCTEKLLKLQEVTADLPKVVFVSGKQELLNAELEWVATISGGRGIWDIGKDYIERGTHPAGEDKLFWPKVKRDPSQPEPRHWLEL